MVSWQVLVVSLLVVMALWYLKSMAENFARGQNDKLVSAFQAQLDKQRDTDRHNLELMLAGVNAEHARLTDESRLYVTRQHDAYAKVYRFLHRAHDEYLMCLERTSYVPDISKFSAEELDDALKEDQIPQFKRKEILALWTADTWRQALHVLDQYQPLHKYQRATRMLQQATNAFLGARLYFSDEVAAAVESLMREIRGYDWKVLYGIQRAKDEELRKAGEAMRSQLDSVYAMMRRELGRPVQRGTPVQ